MRRPHNLQSPRLHPILIWAGLFCLCSEDRYDDSISRSFISRSDLRPHFSPVVYCSAGSIRQDGAALDRAPQHTVKYACVALSSRAQHGPYRAMPRNALTVSLLNRAIKWPGGLRDDNR